MRIKVDAVVGANLAADGAEIALQTKRGNATLVLEREILSQLGTAILHTASASVGDETGAALVVYIEMSPLPVGDHIALRFHTPHGHQVQWALPIEMAKSLAASLTEHLPRLEAIASAGTSASH